MIDSLGGLETGSSLLSYKHESIVSIGVSIFPTPINLRFIWGPRGKGEAQSGVTGEKGYTVKLQLFVKTKIVGKLKMPRLGFLVN